MKDGETSVCDHSSLLRVHIVGGNFVFVVSEGFGEQDIRPHLLSRGSVSSIYVIR